MKEANNRMPKLFDFGMQCGHPLLVQQYKLTYVSRVKQKCEKCVGCPSPLNERYHWNHNSPTDQVEIPLLGTHQMKMAGDVYLMGAVAAGEEVDEDLFGQFSFCDELLNRMYKFLEVVHTTFQQLHIQGIFLLSKNKQV